MELPSGCVVPGSSSMDFWLLFCKLLRGLLKRKDGYECGRGYLKIKIFYFLSTQKHRENGKRTGQIQGKDREFSIDCIVETLTNK